MIVLTPEQAKNYRNTLEKYRNAVYEPALKTNEKNFFARPPYQFTPAPFKKKYRIDKATTMSFDNFSQEKEKSDYDTAVASDMNILIALSELGVATENQIMKVLEAKDRIESTDIAQGLLKRDTKALSNRLKVLKDLCLVRLFTCNIDGESQKRYAFVLAHESRYLIDAKIPTGSICFEEMELTGPPKISSRLIAGDITLSLAGLPEFRGFGLRMIKWMNRIEDWEGAGVEWNTLDGRVVMEWPAGLTHVAVISVTDYFDARFATPEMARRGMLNAIKAGKDFIAYNNFTARVIFVCSTIEILEMMPKLFDERRMSEGGFSEFCYLTTQPVNFDCVNRGENPLKLTLQVAYDPEREMNYLVPAIHNMREPIKRMKKEKKES